VVLSKVLGKHGVNKIHSLNEKFDANKHEALFEVDDPSGKPGTIAIVSQTGYTIGERLLRAAKVGVRRGTTEPEVRPEDTENKPQETK
jgi:molecular chaperone GrpE